MKSKNNKKKIILYVLKMLQDGSSPAKPITQTSMAKVLNSLGINCDRKTIGRNIDCLIDFGFNITKIKGGGCYYNKNSNTPDEIFVNFDDNYIQTIPQIKEQPSFEQYVIWAKKEAEFKKKTWAEFIGSE